MRDSVILMGIVGWHCKVLRLEADAAMPIEHEALEGSASLPRFLRGVSQSYECIIGHIKADFNLEF